MMDDSLGFPYYRLFYIWWFSFLKIKNGDSLIWKYIHLEDLPNWYFMFFDRYEIHIQAFLYFINGKLIICQSSSPQNYFKNMYSKSPQTKKRTIHNKNIVPRSYIFPKRIDFVESQIDAKICSQDDSILSCIFWSIVVIDRRSTGPDFDKIFEVPEII